MSRVLKYRYLHVVQCLYGTTWEDVAESEDRAAARRDLRAYQANPHGQSGVRLIQRRELAVKPGEPAGTL